MSRGHQNETHEAAHDEPAPAPKPAPAPGASPAPTLEERVARLEAYLPRLEAILGPVAPPSPDQPPAGG